MTGLPIHPGLESLLKREFVTINRANQLEFRHRLDEIADRVPHAPRPYVYEFDRACAQRYLKLAGDYLARAIQRVGDVGEPWTRGLRDGLALIIEAQLTRDRNSIIGIRNERLDRAYDRFALGQMDSAKDVASRRIDEELDARVLRQDRRQLPLLELLKADRYKEVFAHVVAAREALSVPGQDHDVVREAVLAVEAVARLAVGENTLGDCVNKLRQQGDEASRNLFTILEKLWAYSNNARRVRHGGSPGESVSPTHADFVMQVAEAAVRMLLTYDCG